MKYLITGGSGFLGRHLLKHLDERKVQYRATFRLPNENPNAFVTGDLTAFELWDELFSGIDVVIHTAAKAHDMSGSDEVKKLYVNVNTGLTQKLATEAKKRGVKRFIFISTIKVNGEGNSTSPFSAEDRPQPADPYGISKLEAEKNLMSLHESGVFEVVVIRPCLIYGAGVKANFHQLINMVNKGLPLPFGLVKNKRSFVSVENLLDLLMTASSHPKAAGETFLVSDDQDLSLPELIRAIASSQGKKALLLPVPVSFINFGLKLIGKSDVATRLFGNLQVDISKTKRLLNWRPPFTMEQSLKLTCQDRITE